MRQEADIVRIDVRPEPAIDVPQDATELVGKLLAPVRDLPVEPPVELPTVPLDEVVETLEDARTLLPEDAEALPDIEIRLEPGPIDLAPVEPPAVEPPVVEPPVPAPVQPPDPTALLVLDEATAKELGIPSRTTITLTEAVREALAILGERTGLELSIAVPST
jgi:hypothetical protein